MMPPRVLTVIALVMVGRGEFPARASEAVETGAGETVSIGGKAGEEEETGGTGDRTVFPEEKFRELFAQLTPPPVEPEPAATQGVETLDEIVELQPYVVQGDRGLLLARIRRELDLGRDSIRRRVAELNESLGKQVQFSGRASDQFFSAQSPGSVRDRQEIFAVPADQMRPVRDVVGEVIDRLFGRDRD
ncbi:MAG: hypothetical protein D6781_01150 [Verrucomicrobia bacterium]|nr:MAG: hypothetical protein D6781_01150 [Verrucomicrobiota bacterium]